MARYFLDSCALVKHFHQESGSDKVEALFATAGSRFLISRLALVELHSAFARLVREGLVTQNRLATLIRRLDGDVAAGVLTVGGVSSGRLADAAKLLVTEGLKANMRTLDAIHLATAQAMHARSRLAAFVAADKKLLSAAVACGLTVLDVG